VLIFLKVPPLTSGYCAQCHDGIIKKSALRPITKKTRFPFSLLRNQLQAAFVERQLKIAGFDVWVWGFYLAAWNDI
jgi:hypothetical protein